MIKPAVIKPAVIKPFRATYYNPLLIKDHSLVVCPPYDVISKNELKCLRKKSPYNFAHALIANNSNYQASGAILCEWLKKGILVDDQEECFYLYEQKFKVEGLPVTRFGILSLLQMDKKGIFPHEHTLSAPKEDRKKMISATEANLSSIFIIAAKRLDVFKEIYELYAGKKPFCKFKDTDNNRNRIWRISDPKQISKIAKAINKCKLIIADGHHRFEISYDYFKKNQNKFKDLNYILAYITDYQKGLNILPTHRVVTVPGGDDIFFSKLKKYFDIKEIKPDMLKRKLKNHSGFCLGICRKNKCYFLNLKNPADLNTIANKIYREIDPYVLHQLILPLFDLKGAIEYTHSLEEARRMASKNKTAFVLRAVSLGAVFKISSKGFRLPQKSTYFYPKLTSGIVIRRFKL